MKRIPHLHRFLLGLFLGLWLPTFAHAHIGSSTVIFEGAAGAYPLRVIIRPPDVIPGRASIDVRFLTAPPEGVRVTVLPVAAGLGLKGAPPPDEALAVRGDETLRHAELWLMTKGSYSVHVDLSGPGGEGRVIVPVAAIAVRQPTMSLSLSVLLGFLGALLFASAVTLVVVGARESTLPPGVSPPPRTGRAILAAGVAILVFGFGVVWGKNWWDQEDRWYRSNQMYRPLPIAAQAQVEGNQRQLRLTLPNDGAGEPVSLLPDHGKLMHLFLIREPQLDAFAHLHPLRTSSSRFDLALPSALPAGSYRLYGDITLENGFASTLTTTVNLPEPTTASGGDGARASALVSDLDDSWSVDSPGVPAPSGFTVKAIGPTAFRAGEPLSLAFEVDDSTGKAVELEPYMGMLGHAAVRRSDGSVFSHLHPVGTISMASQHYFENQARDSAQSTANVAMDHSHMHHGAASLATSVAFPYEFPVEGKYRVWVQAKTQDRVVTGVFDVEVGKK